MVGVFLSFFLLSTFCKPTTCKILSRETNLKRDKNGTEPQENKIKNALLRISASEYLLHGYKGTILSREKQIFAYKSLLHRRFAMLGIFGKILQIPFSRMCFLLQMLVKIRFTSFVQDRGRFTPLMYRNIVHTFYHYVPYLMPVRIANWNGNGHGKTTAEVTGRVFGQRNNLTVLWFIKYL